MIYYFSGTGNSQWAADRLAEKTGDTAAKIADVMKSDSSSRIHICKGQKIGLVFPVYAWNMPVIVEKFVSLLDIEKGAFCYAVCTCGAEAGYTLKLLNKHIRLSSGYSLVMPNNYIISGDVDSESEALEKVRNAAQKLDTISDEINSRTENYDVDAGSLAAIKSFVISHFFRKYAMTSKPFRSESKCNGCGLCEKVCPVGNITVADGLPFWWDKCEQCLACLHRCPQKAIQYGKTTASKGRYYFDFDIKEIDGQ